MRAIYIYMYIYIEREGVIYIYIYIYIYICVCVCVIPSIVSLSQTVANLGHPALYQLIKYQHSCLKLHPLCAINNIKNRSYVCSRDILCVYIRVCVVFVRTCTCTYRLVPVIKHSLISQPFTQTCFCPSASDLPFTVVVY